MSKALLENPEGWEHVLAACDVLDRVVDDIFDLPEAAEARADAAREESENDHGDDLMCGCQAAPHTAAALLQLLGRHVDAVLVLLKQHAAFTTPITTLARAIIEQSLRIAWLLGDDDVGVRERRFVELEKEEQRLRVAVGDLAEDVRQQWEDGIAEPLAALSGSPQAGIPSTEALCRNYGSDRLYIAYRWFSQPVHGTAVGATSFHFETRRGLHDMGRGGSEWLDSELAALPLYSIWEAVSLAMVAFGDLLAPEFERESLAGEKGFRAELRKVPPNAGWLTSQPKTPKLDALMSRAKPNRAQRRKMEALRRKRSGQ